MGLSEEQRRTIKEFMLNEIKVEHNPYEETLNFFKVSRQTLTKYLNELIKEDVLEVEGGKTKKKYNLKTITKNFSIGLNKDTDEQEIYEQFIEGQNQNLSENTKTILQYASTEIINNAIDHSGSEKLIIQIQENYFFLDVYIRDLGIGIFKKIMQDFKLNTEDEAIFQLSKGKLTSDETKHTGEGIFFSSRACDGFTIYSEGKLFKSANDKDRLESHFIYNSSFDGGTLVGMRFSKKSDKKLVDIFKQYQDEDFGFSKTEIRIKLAEQFATILISRSQAKRVMANCKKFTETILDFNNVQEIGQGFADEIFRVYQNANKELKIQAINMNENVKFMVDRAIKSK